MVEPFKIEAWLRRCEKERKQRVEELILRQQGRRIIPVIATGVDWKQRGCPIKLGYGFNPFSAVCQKCPQYRPANEECRGPVTNNNHGTKEEDNNGQKEVV